MSSRGRKLPAPLECRCGRIGRTFRLTARSQRWRTQPEIRLLAKKGPIASYTFYFVWGLVVASIEVPGPAVRPRRDVLFRTDDAGPHRATFADAAAVARSATTSSVLVLRVPEVSAGYWLGEITGLSPARSAGMLHRRSLGSTPRSCGDWPSVPRYLSMRVLPDMPQFFGDHYRADEHLVRANTKSAAKSTPDVASRKAPIAAVTG